MTCALEDYQRTLWHWTILLCCRVNTLQQLIRHHRQEWGRIRGFSTTMRYINRHYLFIYLSMNEKVTAVKLLKSKSTHSMVQMQMWHMNEVTFAHWLVPAHTMQPARTQIAPHPQNNLCMLTFTGWWLCHLSYAAHCFHMILLLVTLWSWRHSSSRTRNKLTM